MQYQLNIIGSQGYAADQVVGLTVGELRRALADLDDEDELVLVDEGNHYGAKFGELTTNIEEVVNE